MDQEAHPVSAANKPLSISFNLHRRDLFFSYMTVSFRNPIIAGVYVCMVLMILSTILSVPDFQSAGLVKKIFVLVFGFVFLSVLLFVVQAIYYAIVVFFQRDKGILGRHSLEITEDGLSENTDVNRTLYKWSGIYKIVRRSLYLYVYVGTFRYFLIPKREIGPEQLEQFDTELRRRVATAKK